MPPPLQGPKDPVSPFHIDQLLRLKATPHLHPSRIELAIASWDTLDTPPKRRAVHILKANAQWWVLHWTHGGLMAAQAYTPEVGPEDPPRGRQRLLQATTLTGRDTPEPREAWVMQAKAMRNYHLHHPFDDMLVALPKPKDPSETVRKLADLARNRVRATMQTAAEPPLRDPGQQATHPFFQPHAPPAPPPPVPPKQARGKRGAPAPSPLQPSKDSRATTSQPPATPLTLLTNSASAPHPDQASSSSSLPPQAPPQPEAYPEFKKGTKVQQPFRNDHTGDWIWCEGTIQYRLQELGPKGGVKIWVTSHRQKELDQGNSAPDKPLGEHLRAQQRAPHPAPHPREQGPQRHQVHHGAPP